MSEMKNNQVKISDQRCCPATLVKYPNLFLSTQKPCQCSAFLIKLTCLANFDLVLKTFNYLKDILYNCEALSHSLVLQKQTKGR